jgi:hypothetical protein
MKGIELHKIATKCKGYAFTALVFLSLATPAQNTDVRLQANKTDILLGEQIVLHLELTTPITASVTFPAIGDTLTAAIEVMQQSAIDTIFPEGDIVHHILVQEYLVTSFDSGSHQIPPLTFQVDNNSIQTRPIAIEVGTVPEEENADFRPIKDPIEVSFSFLEWFIDHWKWIIGSYVLIGLILLYFKFFHGKKKTVKAVELPKEPTIPPHEQALKRLEEIAENKLWQKGELKRYHSEVTEAVRAYIEQRFEIPALEQTTDELFGHLRYVELTEQNRMQLRQLLLLADMVKFAKEQPRPEENERSMQNAVAFVKATQEILTITPEKEAPQSAI